MMIIRKTAGIQYKSLNRITFLFLMLLYVVPNAAGQKGVNDYRNKIDSLIKSKSHKPFNGIILITQNGKTLYQRINGFSDLEEKKPLDIKDQFVIGSISKQITAVLVLQAYEKGIIQLNIPIRHYLPGIKESWADTITVHHLLTHTHGITALDKPLLFKPDTQFEYSQLGFELLANILEKVTNKSFIDLSSELFDKCGMKNSFHPDKKAYKRLVKGYSQQPDGAVIFETESFNNYVPAGSFISSVNDLELWNASLYGGKLLKRVRII